MLKKNWEPEELIESWTLIPQELKLVRKKVGGNQIGFALLLKYFQLFARFPDSSEEIPDLIICNNCQSARSFCKLLLKL